MSSKQSFIDGFAPYILAEAISTFGAENQLNVAIEEMSELTKELCKYKRGLGNAEAIAEELADVRIMLDQIEMLFPEIPRMVRRQRRRKLERLYYEVQKVRTEQCRSSE